MFQSVLQFWSEAATVSHFEKYLTMATVINTGPMQLTHENLMTKRGEFLIFFRDDLHSFSFSGLRWWKLCIRSIDPMDYHIKLLNIIKGENIACTEITLQSILTCVAKIFNTRKCNKGIIIDETILWQIISELLNVKHASDKDKKPLGDKMLRNDITTLVLLLDGELNDMENIPTNLRQWCCNKILRCVHLRYDILLVKYSWNNLKYYKEDNENMEEHQNLMHSTTELDEHSNLLDHMPLVRQFDIHSPTITTVLHDISNNIFETCSYDTPKID